MRMYKKPEFDIIEFETDDVICTSEASSEPTVVVNGMNAQPLPATNVSIFEN